MRREGGFSSVITLEKKSKAGDAKNKKRLNFQKKSQRKRKNAVL